MLLNHKKLNRDVLLELTFMFIWS